MVYDGIIEGLTIDMRSVVPDDAEATYAMRMDKDKVRYMHKISGTVEDQRAYIVNQNKKQGDYLFLVLDKQGNPIGMRGIYDVKEDSAESGRTIGYGNAFQNMEALLLGFDFAFETLGVCKVFMDAAADNSSVRGIQQQIGAIEYDRKFLDDLGYEYVFSCLDKESYYEKREKIHRMIEKYAKRRTVGA